ncbi:MAG TPA: BamA/TamA family outer membrane protein [Kofleriaceae bacterium]|nr:BamA/TamA family outer membrane protein [Kofleriaceae bacterium]
MRGRLVLRLGAIVIAIAVAITTMPAAAQPRPEPRPAPAQPAAPAPSSATPAAPPDPGDPPPDPTDPPPDLGDPLPDPDEPPPAPGDPPPAPGDPPPEPPLTSDGEFGPLLLIEQIDIVGNTATQEEVIRRALPIQPGDVLRASDKRLGEARFKVLALGFFRDVTLAMNKGSKRGQVIIEVRVVERGTVVLNRLWFGTASLTPYWAGADVGERNLLGLGVAIGGGFVYAANGGPDSGPDGGPEGARSQWALELRAADPSVLGTRWGASGSVTLVHGSEAYRVAGEGGEPDDAELRAFPYRRLGLRAGTTFNASALTRLSAGLRVEQIDATLPVAPTRELPDGRIAALDLHLDPGTSRVVAASFGFDRDTRPDPILPHGGGHLALGAELGTLAGGDYQFAALFGRYDHYWSLFDDKHAIAIKVAGGVVIGDAPLFDRVHIADVNRMLTPRALGLVLSTAAPLDLLGTRAEKPAYGDLGGSASVEYAVQLFRGKGAKRVYGGDLFFGAGLWGLAEDADLRARDASVWRSLPVDLYLDAGIRLDTDIGVFELTVANALGRLR